MSSVAITNTFTNVTTADASQVNTNFTDLSTYINNRNSASATWDAVSSSSATNVPIVANNSSGTQNIANFQDNGTNVLAIADGGIVTILPVATSGVSLTATAANGGSGKALIANNGTSTGNIFEAQDNGTAKFTIADGGGVTVAAAVAMSTNKITGLGAATASGDAVRFEQLFAIMQFTSGTGTTAAGVTNFFGNAGTSATVTANEYICPLTGTITNLYAHTGVAIAAGTHTFTLYKNGSSTALTCTVTGSATDGNDTTHSVSVSAGDRLTIQDVGGGGATTSSANSSVRITPA